MYVHVPLGCTVTLRVVAGFMPTSFVPIFPPSVPSLTFLIHLELVFPNLANIHCFLGHNGQLPKQRVWKSKESVLAPGEMQ